MAKGADYERFVCKTLSKWFSKGADDGWYWRTSMSGGRATIRSRKGQSTHGNASDITATCPQAKPLTDLISFECKVGYKSGETATVLHCFDKLSNAKEQVFESWIRQARASAKVGKSPYWAIIQRRNQKRDVIWIPSKLAQLLDKQGAKLGLVFPMMMLRFTPHGGEDKLTIVGFLLEDFFEAVKPQHIRDLWRYGR